MRKRVYEEDIYAIREVLLEGRFTQQEIADKFEVSQGTVSRIVNGYIGGHLPWPDGSTGPMPRTANSRPTKEEARAALEEAHPLREVESAPSPLGGRAKEKFRKSQWVIYLETRSAIIKYVSDNLEAELSLRSELTPMELAEEYMRDPVPLYSSIYRDLIIDPKEVIVTDLGTFNTYYSKDNKPLRNHEMTYEKPEGYPVLRLPLHKDMTDFRIKNERLEIPLVPIEVKLSMDREYEESCNKMASRKYPPDSNILAKVRGKKDE